MRGLAVGVWFALAGCYLAHERPPLDAAIVPDASRPDAHYVAPNDAWVVPHDAYLSPDTIVAPDAFREPDAYMRGDAYVERPDAGPVMRSGYLVVGQEHNDGVPPFDYLTASFSDVRPADLRQHMYYENCVFLATTAQCQLVSCSTGADSYPAGTLSVEDRTGLVLEAPHLSLTNTDPAYLDYFATHLGASIAGGDLLEIHVSGDDVPAFDTELVMPPWVLAVMPRTVSRTTDWVVTWPPTTEADMWVGIVLTSGSSIRELRCQSAGTAGSVVVPSSVLSHFDVGAEVSTFASSANAVYVQTGVYLVEVSAVQGRVVTTLVRP